MEDTLNNLQRARHFLNQGLPDKALPFGKRAYAKNPESPDVIAVMAGINMLRGYHEIAHAFFSRAAKLRPTDQNFQLNYAFSSKSVGKIDQAVLILERLIDQYPDFAPAYYALANSKKFAATNDPWIQKFEALKRNTATNRVYQELVLFALGKIYDDLGDYDRAFLNYQKANDSPGHHYDHAKEIKYIQEIQTNVAQKNWGDGFHSKKPVFLVGMPRTGSTLVENRLTKSEDIHGLGELNDIYHLYKQAIGPSPRSAQDYGQTYLSRMENINGNAARLVDKNLFNHEFIGFIRAILPDAKIVDLRRDPIDTCLSCYFQRFGVGLEFSYSLTGIASKYALYHETMKNWSIDFDMFTFSYEEHIASPHQSMQRLFTYLDVPAPSEFSISDNHAVATASAWQVRQPLYKSSIKRWENYKKHLDPLISELERRGVPLDIA